MQALPGSPTRKQAGARPEHPKSLFAFRKTLKIPTPRAANNQPTRRRLTLQERSLRHGRAEVARASAMSRPRCNERSTSQLAEHRMRPLDLWMRPKTQACCSCHPRPARANDGGRTVWATRAIPQPQSEHALSRPTFAIRNLRAIKLCKESLAPQGHGELGLHFAQQEGRGP